MKFTRTELVLGTTRLLDMCRFIERVPEEKFDFEHIVSNIGDYYNLENEVRSLSCGTKCCFLGYIPIFLNKSAIYSINRGFIDFSNYEERKTEKYKKMYSIRDECDGIYRFNDFLMSAYLFSLYPWEVQTLFVPKYQIFDDNSEVETKQEVVEQIREFCRYRIQMIKKMPLGIMPKAKNDLVLT